MAVQVPARYGVEGCYNGGWKELYKVMIVKKLMSKCGFFSIFLKEKLLQK